VHSLDDPVGINEIAAHFRRDRSTVVKWRGKPDFPPPRWPRVNGGPAWKLSDVVDWKKSAVKSWRKAEADKADRSNDSIPA
jgi:hypothetical protein